MALVLHLWLNLATWAAVGGTALHALVRGRLPERSGAALFGFTAIASAVLQRGGGASWSWGSTLGLDALLTFGLLAIALRSDRWWPLWATAAQALAAISLASTPLLPLGRGNPFFFGELIWEVVLVVVMNIGFASESRRGLPASSASSPSY